MPNYCSNEFHFDELPNAFLTRCTKKSEHYRIDKLLEYAIILSLSGILKPNKDMQLSLSSESGNDDVIALAKEPRALDSRIQDLTSLLEMLADDNFRVLGFEDENTKTAIDVLERIAQPLVSFEELRNSVTPDQWNNIATHLARFNLFLDETDLDKCKAVYNKLLEEIVECREKAENNTEIAEASPSYLSMDFDLFVSRPLKGCLDSRDMNIAIYGTKWNSGGEVKIEPDGLSTSTFFQTAWSPAIPVIKAIVEKYGLTGKFIYHECGCDFAGLIEYENGEITNEEYNEGLHVYDDEGEPHDPKDIEPAYLADSFH